MCRCGARSEPVCGGYRWHEDEDGCWKMIALPRACTSRFLLKKSKIFFYSGTMWVIVPEKRLFITALSPILFVRVKNGNNLARILPEFAI
jgi:hypothetical protein